ncbi:MAG: UvrD-helicase domain-containing protein [Bacteroidales bacterium]
MDQGRIIKYTASAGSGKTQTLTGEYLLRLFANPSSYRRILAVTFTNKAAAEMKSRILEELSSIAAGKETSLLDLIVNKSGITRETARIRAADLLSSVLSDYSRFSVGTIDSFFQRVFRAFAREIGLQSNFNIYLDFSLVLHETIEDLIHNLNQNEELRKWLVRYAGALFLEGKHIDLAGSVYNLSRTIFSEKYKLLHPEVKQKLSDMTRIEKFVSDMEEVSESFVSRLRRLGEEGVEIIEKNGVEDSMLSGGKNGVGRYLRTIASGEIKQPYKVIFKALAENKWHGSSGPAGPLEAALADGLGERVSAIAGMMENDYPGYMTAKLIRQNIYMAAILSDVVNVLRERTNSENSFVLADTGDLLMQVIGNDQTPFIYEKTGNEYDVFMIDEFQDTSMIQYRNFKPLIENSLAQGSDTLVVGDIKQSIYRWRNGDWSILGRLLEGDFSGERVESRALLTNWRSRPEIVKFNNTLFTLLPKMIEEELRNSPGSDAEPEPELAFSIEDIYRDIIQSVPAEKNGGYVRLAFMASDDEGRAETKILEELPGIIMRCQDDGYSAADIGILVRKRAEGTTVVDHLTRFRESMSPEDTSRYNFNMLSGESLLVGSSPAVCFIVAVMVRITDSSNQLNRGEMLRYYLLATSPGMAGSADINLAGLEETEESIYPKGFREFMKSAGAKPLFTLSEEIIDFFGLNRGESDMASIIFFQDQVLEFMTRRGSGLRAFTEWWLDQGKNNSVVLSGEQDAMNIMTVHKAKGLQFKIVIIPFISWGFDQRSDNLIWVVPEEEPFSDAGAFPVSYTQSLKQTIFSSDYYFERASSYLDNLNLMYVVFTRAVERLYGYSFSRGKNDAGAILRAAMEREQVETENTISLNSYFNRETGIFELGYPDTNKSERIREPLVPAEYPVFRDDKRLKLRLYGRDLLREATGDLKSRIYYGTVLHDILGRVRCRKDIDAAVNNSVEEGYINTSAAAGIRKMLKEMLSRPGVSAWFDDDVDAMTEPEILTGTGDIRRPDRVVIKDGRVTVIDYKFGEERSEHRRQMETYRDLLTGMGYDVDAACLWYVESEKVVKV